MSPTGRTKAEDYIGAPKRPFTGKEYLESLRDGREIYVYGERVPDVTTHPAFRNAARSIAKTRVMAAIRISSFALPIRVRI
jgi:hypothetical protein